MVEKGRQDARKKVLSGLFSVRRLIRKISNVEIEKEKRETGNCLPSNIKTKTMEFKVRFFPALVADLFCLCIQAVKHLVKV